MMYQCETTEDFDEFVKEQSRIYLQSKMVTTIIAAENNIKVTAKDITNQGAELAQQYNMGTFQDLVEQYGTILNCEMGYQVLYNKVSELIRSNVKEVETTTSTEATEKSTEKESTEATTTTKKE